MTKSNSIPALIAGMVGLLFTGSGFAAQDGPYKAVPFEFVGTKAQCAPFPKGKKTVTAKWIKDIGLDDDSGNKDLGLLLEKEGETANCAAAGAVIDGVEGIELVSLGYDLKDGGHCNAGAPRFNVDASDGFHFIGGCSNGVLTPGDPGWTQVRFDVTNPAQAFPPITPGATINSIAILFDEGEDTATPGAGQAIIDNIQIESTNNEVLIGSNKSESN